MKKLISAFKIILIVIIFSCNNHKSNLSLESSESFSNTDSIVINEIGLKCRLFKSTKDTLVYLRECYWDSLLTKISSRHLLKNGIYNGSCKYWTPEGVLVSSGVYSDNKKSGIWTFYTGKYKSEDGEYKNGDRIGVWKEFDSTGKVIKTTDY